MPVHDWTRVENSVFQAFHLQWIAAITNSLNGGLLPIDFYALPEPHIADSKPDIPELQMPIVVDRHECGSHKTLSGGRSLSRPRIAPTSKAEIYPAKQNIIKVRHISDDEVVAVIEIVSPGNKNGRLRLDRFVNKSAGLLSQQIHLLLIDIHPPGPRDPRGIHAEIWEVAGGSAYTPPAGKPLTQVAYEAGEIVSAYVVPFGVGDALSEMPLFLNRQGCIHVPLEQTYRVAFDVQPRRWKDVLARK